MKNSTLPNEFYSCNKWQDHLINHYTNEHFTPNAIEYPIKALTTGLETIIKVYGNYPKDVSVLLSQAINPLYSPEEYKEKIYDVIKSEAIINKNPYIDAVAESLYYIRLLFEQNKEYITEHFDNEINIIDAYSDEEKLEQFSAYISAIVKNHTAHLEEMINDYCFPKTFIN